MNKRIGIDTSTSSNLNAELIKELIGALEASQSDYNCFFYELSKLESLNDISSILNISIYRDSLIKWFESYKRKVREENISIKNRNSLMKKVNPKYIIKNYMLQESIDKAEEGNFTLVNDLLNIAQNPYEEHKKYERYSKPTPIKEANLQLSCSS